MTVILIVIIIHLCFLAPIPGINNSAFLFNDKNDELEIAYYKVGFKRLNIHTCTILEPCSISIVQLNLNNLNKKA